MEFEAFLNFAVKIRWRYVGICSVDYINKYIFYILYKVFYKFSTKKSLSNVLHSNYY